jgi:hypothetical protein
MKRVGLILGFPQQKRTGCRSGESQQGVLGVPLMSELFWPMGQISLLMCLWFVDNTERGVAQMRELRNPLWSQHRWKSGGRAGKRRHVQRVDATAGSMITRREGSDYFPLARLIRRGIGFILTKQQRGKRAMAGGRPHGVDVEKEIATRLKAPNLCFLFGAGSSRLAGYPLMSELTEIASDTARKKTHVSKALDALSGTTIEDQLEELLGQLRSPDLSQMSEPVLRESVEHILDVIFEECSKPAPLDTHQTFVRAVFNRVSDKRQIHTFTTNYDMLFEWAADREMIYCVNGFYGIQARTFDATQFDMRPAIFINSMGL